MAEIDLSLFGLVFGVNKGGIAVNVDDIPQRTQRGRHGTPYYATNNLGREYYLPVRITYSDPPKAGLIDSGLFAQMVSGSITLGDAATRNPGQAHVLDLPHPLVSINCEKHIVETPMTERQGNVIEVTGIKNFEITIRGFMVSSTRDLPEEQIQRLHSVFMAGNSVKLYNVITDIYLIDIGRQAVVRSFSLPEVRGMKGVRPYELKLVSDSVFSLYEI
jgi:hypothetical protein